MSPILHRALYGVTVYEGVMYAEELGKWGSRPAVFMANPLELGLLMTMACISGLALVCANRGARIGGIRVTWLLTFLLLTSLACKNLGATALLATGVGAVCLCRYQRSLFALYVLALILPSYALLRTTSKWDGESVVRLAGLVHERKAASFEFRLENENMLVEKALERPVLGWGGWGRSRVYNDRGEDISVTDGKWILTLGQWGFLGLGLLICVYVTPVVAAGRRIQKSLLDHPHVTAALAAMTLITLLAIDSIPNDFSSPLYLAAAGGCAGLPRICARPSPVRVGGQNLAREGLSAF
jgi:hypothetical protein